MNKKSDEVGTKKHGAIGFGLDSEGDRAQSRVFKQDSNTALFKDAFWKAHSECKAGKLEGKLSTKEARRTSKR